MIPSLTRSRLGSALGLVGAMAFLACDRGATERSTAEARTLGRQVAAVTPGEQYDPAITVYKNPT